MKKNIFPMIAVAALALAASTGVMAEVPAEVTASVNGAKADLVSIIGTVIAAMATVWGVRLIGKKNGLVVLSQSACNRG